MDLMTIDEVVALSHVSKGNLASMRYDRRGPKFFKPTPKTVLYDRQSVLDWLAESAVPTTPEGDPARVASHNKNRAKVAA